jgi:hypothetical protein
LVPSPGACFAGAGFDFALNNKTAPSGLLTDPRNFARFAEGGADERRPSHRFVATIVGLASGHSHCAKPTAAQAPASWATMKAGTPAAAMPA